MPMSDFLEDALLKLVLNNVAYTPPASVYIALFTGAPTDAGGGTEVPFTNGYARVQLTGGFTVTPPATRADNTADVAFPQATSTGWGLVTDVGIFDAATGGNLLFWGAISSPRTVLVNDVFQFSATGLGITLT